jgi:thioredoxin-like negative regulator of GroEL
MALDDISATDFEEQVLNTTLAVGILCWRRTDAPSRFMMPGLEELAQENRDVLKIFRLNVDDQPGLASMLRVPDVPTIVFYRESREIGRIEGSKPRKQLVRELAGLDVFRRAPTVHHL